MNFLNRAKETASNVINNDNKGGSPLHNPFIKQDTVNSQSKPILPTGNVPKPAIPGKPPLGKPGVPPVGMPKSPIGKPGLPGKPPASTLVVEEVVPVIVEPVKVEEVIVAETPIVEPVAVETVEVKPVEEEPKKKSRRKPASKKPVEPSQTETISNDNTTVEAFVTPATDLDYANCVTAIKSQFVDEEWETFRTEITTVMSEIIISNDMNKPQLHDLLSQISLLRDRITVAHNDTKTLYESLTSKENGLIDRVKKLNSKGSNAEEKKLNATIAVMNYKSNEGHNINLFELLDETRSRYNFLCTVMENIEFKKYVLLTMLSSLKLEK